MSPIRFVILGPPAIAEKGEEIRLATRRSRAVLAHLLLRPAFSASVDTLVDAIYGDTPSKSARNQVHRGVGELRRHGVTIDVHDNVYTLAAAEDEVDAFVFARSCERAADCSERGDHGGTARTLREALRLWRGPALDGLDSTASVTAAEEWNERRMTATEDRVDADLALGRHREIIAELRHLTGRHPLRERFHGQLMLALYRSERGSEALRVFADLEALLRTELGTDPAPALQELHLRVLRQDSTLELTEEIAVEHPAATPVPRQLPPRPGRLVGRDPEQLPLAPLTVFTGPGGSGKTALCLEAAHRMAPGHPDGQLFADDLRDPGEVLAAFLFALGVSGIPAGVAARSALLRSVLASRRVLIVLDGVSDPRVVRLFLPGHDGCAVLVTSHSPLATLPDAVRVDVPPLAPGDALALLAEGAGARRVAAEPEAAARVAELCARLPAALRIAAAKLAVRPHWRLEHLAQRLSDPARILRELRHDDRAMTPILARGYEALRARHRALLRAIGYYGVPEVPVEIAAALADAPVDTAATLLEDLAEHHVLVARASTQHEASPGSGEVFRCHELLLGFGADRAIAEDSAPALTAALTRAFGAWLAQADASHAALRGPGHCVPRGSAPRYDVTPAAPGASWFADHLPLLMTAVRRAAAAGLSESCWELAVAPLACFEAGAHFQAWLESHEIALSCARKAGNLRGQAAIHYSLGQRALLVGDYARSAAHLDRALGLFGDLDDRHGRGLALRLQADLRRIHGDVAGAHAAYEEAACLLRETGDPVAEADALGGLALLSHGTDAAQAYLDRALALCRSGGSLRGEAQIRRGLAMQSARTGTPENAYPELLEVLDIATHLGDRVMQSDVLLDLGTTRILMGDPEAARVTLTSAEEVALSSGVARVVARTRQARAFLHDPVL
ncbi:BTAD domain-containing putative transcriptional regulator [Nonomuraea sp. NPDC050536]|uniref:AfsR/SARP family transcriptional regulator n=1 Tax=Nonomuraea sp. NPDC050536 TaxID=3364366 RepID=UPI0037C9920C